MDRTRLANCIFLCLLIFCSSKPVASSDVEGLLDGSKVKVVDLRRPSGQLGV